MIDFIEYSAFILPRHICHLLRRLLDDSNKHIEKCILGEFRKHNEKYHDFTENKFFVSWLWNHVSSLLV